MSHGWLWGCLPKVGELDPSQAEERAEGSSGGWGSMETAVCPVDYPLYICGTHCTKWITHRSARSTRANCFIETWIWIEVYARRNFILALQVFNFICSCLYLPHYNMKIRNKYFSKTVHFLELSLLSCINTECCSFCHCRYLELARHFRPTCVRAKSCFWVYLMHAI